MKENSKISKLNSYLSEAMDKRIVTSVEEFAKKIGISKPTWHRWMKNESLIDNDTLLVARTVSAANGYNAPNDNLSIEALMHRQNQLLEMQNTLLADMKENVSDRVKRIESNLSAVRGQAEGIEFDLVSGREIILQSLARLERKHEGSLLKLADNKKIALLEARSAHYKSSGAGK